MNILRLIFDDHYRERMNYAGHTDIPASRAGIDEAIAAMNRWHRTKRDASRSIFRDDWSTVYHGDNRPILPLLPAGLVVVTDQPYGTGWVRGGGKVGEFKAKHEKPAWDVWSLDWVTLISSPKRIAAFAPVGKCEELCAALPTPAVLHYRKSNVRPGGADREPIVVSPPPLLTAEWKRLAYNGDMPLHPCQKPLDLMTWLIETVSEPGDVILDPFMGSGTTLAAAKLCNRKAIGIEIELAYCEAAVTRLGQGVLAFA